MPAEPEGNNARTVMGAACAILARSTHSREQVRQKLERKGFTSDEIEACLQRLGELGYLNDEDVARRWAQVMLKERCWGLFKARQQLEQRGIDRELAGRVLDEAVQEFPQIDGARQALAGRFAKGPAAVPLARVVNFLRSRGFSAEVVYEAAREWEKARGVSELGVESSEEKQVQG